MDKYSRSMMTEESVRGQPDRDSHRTDRFPPHGDQSFFIINIEFATWTVTNTLVPCAEFVPNLCGTDGQ